MARGQEGKMARGQEGTGAGEYINPLAQCLMLLRIGDW